MRGQELGFEEFFEEGTLAGVRAGVEDPPVGHREVFVHFVDVYVGDGLWVRFDYGKPLGRFHR